MMKKCYYLLIMLVVSYCQLYSQCGPITLNSQAEIDNFATDYPNCTSVNGLTIQGNTIVNLDGLSQITEIDNGQLRIRFCNGLLNVDGLNNLQKVNGDFLFETNNLVSTLAPISDVEFLHGVSIIRNDGLTELTGFNNIPANLPLGGLLIGENQNLLTIEGFNSVETIPAGIVIGGNPNLVSIEAFSNLKELEQFRIFLNEKLETISGLQQFINLVGTIKHLHIFGNDVLQDIDFIFRFNLQPDDEIIIDECPLISNCSYSNICAHLDNGGWALFEENACGCNSVNEVQLSCVPVPPCLSCSGNSQLDALLDFYLDTNGDQWSNNTGWLEDCDYCNWFGVTCDANQNVIGLNFWNNNLSGTLPSSICDLTELETLIVRENTVGGDIPACVGQLKDLTWLQLNNK